MKEMSLPIPPPNVKQYNSTAISLVAIHKDGKWCATHETRGWYMPAGRMDYGESAETGAKREALEEAGIHVNLTNIVRIDFTPGFYTRIRILYKAVPQDESSQLRDISQRDEEIIEAKWVEPEELTDGRAVRSTEMIDLFRFLNTNPYLFPTSLVDSEDGFPVDHNNVVTPTVVSATVILSNPSKTIYYLPKGSEENNQKDFLHLFTFPTEKWISNAFIDSFKCDIELKGIVKIRFLPPHSEFAHRNVAYFNVVYYGVADLSNSPNFYQVNVNDFNNGLLDDYSYNLFLSTLNAETVYPLGVISKEGSRLVSLK